VGIYASRVNWRTRLSYLFRLRLLSKYSYLLEGLQSADKIKTHPKAKLQNASTFTGNGSHSYVSTNDIYRCIQKDISWKTSQRRLLTTQLHHIISDIQLFHSEALTCAQSTCYIHQGFTMMTVDAYLLSSVTIQCYNVFIMCYCVVACFIFANMLAHWATIYQSNSCNCQSKQQQIKLSSFHRSMCSQKTNIIMTDTMD